MKGNVYYESLILLHERKQNAQIVLSLKDFFFENGFCCKISYAVSLYHVVVMSLIGLNKYGEVTIPSCTAIKHDTITTIAKMFSP